MYIRTEDEVWEINNDMYVKDNEAYMRWFDGRGKEIYATYLGKVISQSNNLAELCDGFIITYTEFETEYYAYEKLDDIPLLDLKCKNKYFNIYGFIGTSKGLIYVAKMDNEGKLVLI